MPIHHPTGITVEIVGIEASNNGRSCDQHDVCGSVLDDDVVVRLRKVQILNSQGREETAIAAYLVSDGIDQCRVGFLQRHLVAHAKSFDGVLAQVTEVYSVTSESPSKRKKCLQKMGCCLAAVISAMPPMASSKVNKIDRREDESEEEQAKEMGKSTAGNCAPSTSSDNDEDEDSTCKAPAPPARKSEEQNCRTPESEKHNQNTNSTKQMNDELMLTPPPGITPQRTRAQTNKARLVTTPPPLANSEKQCSSTLASERQSNGKKESRVAKRKKDDSASPASAKMPQSAAKKVVAKEKKKQSDKKKKTGKEDLEVRFTTDGRKMYVNFSDDSRDEDFVLEDDEKFDI